MKCLLKSGIFMGILFRNHKRNAFDAIWVTFLLFNLGGTDSLVSYSVDDNEVWDKCCINVFYQIIVGVYVIYSSWIDEPETYIVLPLFFAAVLKNFEKLYSLRAASIEGYRDAVKSPPNTGIDYPNFLYWYKHPVGRGFDLVSVEDVKKFMLEAENNFRDPIEIIEINEDEYINTNIVDIEAVNRGFEFFKYLNCLFLYHPISVEEFIKSTKFFTQTNATSAFKIVDVELGLLYDLMHTKAVICHSKIDVFLKSVTSSLIVASLTTI
jgi:hypothetical protein